MYQNPPVRGSAHKSIFQCFASVKSLSSTALYQKQLNHYELLGLDRKCSEDEIKKAYLKLSKECHPDLTTETVRSSHEKFIALNNAYSVLSKPRKRELYDRQLCYQAQTHDPRDTIFHAPDSNGPTSASKAEFSWKYEKPKDWSQEFPQTRSSPSKQSRNRVLLGVVAFGVVGCSIVLAIGVTWSKMVRDRQKEKSAEALELFEARKRQVTEGTNTLVKNMMLASLKADVEQRRSKKSDPVSVDT